MKQRLQLLTFTALMAALTAALTFVHLPVPMTNGGYVHLGDGMIYIAACLLPGPYAALAAALGGGIADWLGGAIIWVPATVVIKAAMALMFSAKKSKMLCGRNALALLPASLINVAGYFLYEGLLYKNWAAVLTVSLPGNLIQSGISAVMFVLLALMLDQLKMKSRLAGIAR